MLRVFHHYFSGRKTLFFFAESSAIALACLFGAVGVATAMAPAGSRFLWDKSAPALVTLSLGFVAVFQFVLYLLDLYDLRVAGEDRARGSRLMRAAGVSVLVMGGAMVALPTAQFPAGALLGGALGAAVGSLLLRSAIHSVVGEPLRVLILGVGPRAIEVAKAIDSEAESAFLVCSMVDPASLGVGERYTLSQLPEQSTEGLLTLEQLAANVNAHFLVTVPDPANPRINEDHEADALLRCRVAGRKVYEASGFYERVLRRIPVGYLRAAELAYSDELTVGRTRKVLKRAFDLLMASMLALFASPVMLLFSALIRLDSKGPIFYHQDRVGLDGKPFKLWKFRSMRTDAEKNGAVWAKQNDDRVTRVGKLMRKTRVDEIPQVFNVLFGEMSFVGPRPERPVFVQQLKHKIPFYGLREAVKPGITGWAQIRYPYGASVEDARNKLEYDLYYVKNGSLMLDLAIIFHTVRHVLLGRGAR